MDKETIDKLKKEREYLRDWLEANKTAQEVAPHVQQRLEQIEWEIEALGNRPEEADEIPTDNLVFNIDEGYSRLTSILPSMPRYDPPSIVGWTFASTSGTADIYGFVSRVGDLGTSAAQNYSTKYISEYQKMQQAHDRPNVVRGQLEKLNDANLLERLDRASIAHANLKTGLAERTSAGSEMRNLLYGLRGVLFERARQLVKENMTWKTMAQRLADGVQGGFEEQTLITQETMFNSLISRLSDVAKDREGGSITDLDDIWTQVLDHIYIVLGLIKV
jgi:hypothetical protein